MLMSLVGIIGIARISHMSKMFKRQSQKIWVSILLISTVGLVGLICVKEVCTSINNKILASVPGGWSFGGNITIVLFTSFREREDRLKFQSYVIKNWSALKPWITPVLFTTVRQSSLVNFAKQHGWEVLPVPGTNKYGTPFIKGMFRMAYEKYAHCDFYAYANGDVLFGMGLIKTLHTVESYYVSQPSAPFNRRPFIVGRKTNVFMETQRNDLSNIWHPYVVEAIVDSGMFHPDYSFAVDFFITKRNGYPWSRIPNLVIGRRAYDQYLILLARYHNLTTIDISMTSPALHVQGLRETRQHNDRSIKDSEYNAQIINKIHPYGVPWADGMISSAQVYSRVYEPNGAISLVVKDWYTWLAKGRLFDKYETFASFDDDNSLSLNTGQEPHSESEMTA